MAEFGKLYSRIPKQVYALQWFPHMKLPFVENVFIEVPQQPSSAPFKTEDILNNDVANYFQSVPKNIKVCVNAVVTLTNGEKMEVQPADWVLYSQTTQVPIAVLGTEIFKDSYVDAEKFELCSQCAIKAASLKAMGSTPPDIAELIKILERGRSIELPDGTIIKSFHDLQQLGQAHGINI